MEISRYLTPLYPPLAAVIILFLSGADSYANHEKERDPFRFGSAHSSQPAHEPGEDDDRAVLQMILITDLHRVAVFNGRRYRRGDSMGEYTVTDIEFDKVTVQNGEDKKIFTFYAE